jgi:hypothetical protein
LEEVEIPSIEAFCRRKTHQETAKARITQVNRPAEADGESQELMRLFAKR